MNHDLDMAREVPPRGGDDSTVTSAVFRQRVRRSRAEISAEYAAAFAQHDEPHRRAKWGSAQGMRNRFALVRDAVDWRSVRRWLDLGCGEAGLFRTVEAAGHQFEQLVGLDVCPAMIRAARSATLRSPRTFITGDMSDLDPSGAPLDLVTLIGVLQQTHEEPYELLRNCAARLAPGGQLFLTTKSRDWTQFRRPGWVPEPSHSWFTCAELRAMVERAGLNRFRLQGFLPSEGQVVPIEESHTVFLHAHRRED